MAAESTQHPLERYPDHVRAIGMISLETVALELALASLFSRMLRIPRKRAEAIYFSPNGDRVRLDILRNVAHAAFDPNLRAIPESTLERQKAAALKAVLGIIKRSVDAIEKRHRTMHDLWDISKGIVRRTRFDGRGRAKATPVSLNDLNQQVKSIRGLLDDITDLTNEFDHRPPLMISMKLGP